MTQQFTKEELEGVIHGLEGVLTVGTIKSKVDSANGGNLFYQGIPIETLAEHSTFEETCYLLLYDKLPTRNQLTTFKKKLKRHQTVSPNIKKTIKLIASKEHPLEHLTALVALMDLEDPHNTPDEKNSERIAHKLIIQFPQLVAGVVRIRKKQPYLNPKPNLDIAANFLYQLTGKLPDTYSTKIMDQLLILHADHGLNASTFAGRLAASTQANMYASITAAICTLTGPLHGGANERVIIMLKDISKNIKKETDIKPVVTKYLDKLLTNKGRVMGIGHRVYKEGDPRARILSKHLHQLCEGKTCDLYHKIALEIEGQMITRKSMRSNVDFYSAIVMDGIGIPHDIYTCIFAMGRMAGWTAHILEQYANNRLLRPKAKYVESRQPLGQSYTPINKR